MTPTTAPPTATWPQVRDRALRDAHAWETVPYHRAGEEIAGALLCGTEVHFIISPQHRGRIFPRRLVAEFLAPLFARHGYLTTRCKPGDAASIRFITRIGFARTWHDGVFDHYMLTALPFGARI